MAISNEDAKQMFEHKTGPAKKPWYEYKLEMEKAYHTLQHAMGTFRFDTEYAQIKGFMQGYLAGMAKIEHELDL